ncbi:MAG: spondin domain-containing protein [Chthonomonas sp.]|nr:spondin domain-containing protein [Chthonomonas sp.]
MSCFAAVSAHAAVFTVTWTNHGPQPLSPLFWSVGNASFDIFSLGGTSSAGIKSIAESGNVNPMLNIAAAAGSNVQLYGVLAGGPLMPGLTRSATINVNSGSDYFSFATMLGMTNDGFLGEGVSSMGLRLFGGNTPLGFSVNVYGARAWDAGTEANTQNAADLGALGGSGNPAEAAGFNRIRVHESIVPGRGDSFASLPDWTSNTRLMTLTVLPVPEPSGLVFLGVAGIGMMLRRKRASA